ncbi:SusC/RagA family TonB-linked outer membrane protein [Negadavirga shengliensis]|uniref:SusC/RagA family TonB-linked outer membrane protein n=1 Tax=Negadavirga shengliensis TaxID=1389218 RepID=A0ABV9T449_9BACT
MISPLLMNKKWGNGPIPCSGKLTTLLLFAYLGITTVSTAQQVTTRGQVTDPSGESVPGVNILEKDTNNGTVTDLDGNYEITVSSPEAILVFSFVGFETQEIPVEGRTQLDAMLSEDTRSLDEVVVVGYGVQRKSDLTGAISSVKSQDITRLPTPNVTQALQGRVSGVQVTSTSGAPGAGTTVRVRGVGTLNNADPLFVVDGMLLENIDFLNPNDVESIEVLKDASATAIYGSRGANGVIIVTTKQGAFDQAATISVNAYTGVQQVADRISMVNARQYTQLANELRQNEGAQPPYNEDEFGAGTDWQDFIFRNAPINDINIGATGGTASTSYNLNVNYFNQQGVVRESDFERLTVRLNNQYKASDAVRFGHNLSFIYFNRQDEPSGIVATAYRALPIFEPRQPDGSFTDMTPTGNPAASFEYNRHNENHSYRAVGNFFMDVDFLQYFTFRSNMGVDFIFNDSRVFTPTFYVSPAQQVLENMINVSNNRTRNWLWENTITFEREWDSHRLNVLAGITSQDFYYEELGGQRRNLPGEDPSLWYLNAGEEITQTNNNLARDWSMVSYLFRVNYVFNDKYLFTGTVRVDGSSRFGRENRYGTFPSVAAGWRIAEEGFMQNFDVLSDLKLRASWGIIGNDKIGEYEGRPVVTGNENAVFGPGETLTYGAALTRLANPFIQWEETVQSDIGFEFGLFDNKLTGEVDYYFRRTNDILVSVPIPAYVGSAENPVVNAASVENRGWDITLNWRERRGDFGYDFGIIASTVRNTVLDIGEGNEAIFGGAVGISGLLGSRTIIGESIGHFFGYRTLGVFQNQNQVETSPTRGPEVPGDLIFQDTNGDGLVDSNDRIILGSPIPELIFGFHFGADYRGFDLRADFNGTYGNKIYNSKKQTRFDTYNFETTYLDRWTGEGTSDTEPRVTNGGHNYEVSDRFIEDGSFLRLRNVQLGYTFNQTFLDRFNINNFRVYLSGTNLFTITNYTGYTPEIGGGDVLGTGYDNGVYPISRVVNLGISANF